MRDELPRKKERKTAVSRLAFHKMNSYKKIMFDKNKESEKVKFISQALRASLKLFHNMIERCYASHSKTLNILILEKF